MLAKGAVSKVISFDTAPFGMQKRVEIWRYGHFLGSISIYQVFLRELIGWFQNL